MKKLLFLFFALFVSQTRLAAQNPVPAPAATETIQQSQSANAATLPAKTEEPVASASPTSQSRGTMQVRIPAGTPIDVEVAYTVSSLDMRPGELLSFRVLVPIIIEGVTVIERDALVTARVTLSKRGGHWGKSGRLVWAMEDVVAADNSRVLLDPATHSRNEELWSLENKDKAGKSSKAQTDQGVVKGTSHKTEVVTKTVIAAAIFPPLAPLALVHGFRRGENAVLPEGKRFVVAVRDEASVSVPAKD
jgi:nitrate reductase NapE component